MNALLSIIAGVFASLAFATAIGYTRLYLYLTNRPTPLHRLDNISRHRHHHLPITFMNAEKFSVLCIITAALFFCMRAWYHEGYKKGLKDAKRIIFEELEKRK